MHPSASHGRAGCREEACARPSMRFSICRRAHCEQLARSGRSHEPGETGASRSKTWRCEHKAPLNAATPLRKDEPWPRILSKALMRKRRSSVVARSTGRSPGLVLGRGRRQLGDIGQGHRQQELMGFAREPRCGEDRGAIVPEHLQPALKIGRMSLEGRVDQSTLGHRNRSRHNQSRSSVRVEC